MMKIRVTPTALNDLKEIKSYIENDLSNPMWNYATQHTTAPGSTFKMVTAAAALEEGAKTRWLVYRSHSECDRPFAELCSIYHAVQL